ncbi:baculoviral IAP repeat-containing protein 2 isoform X1 [Aricia agestis]|nr:baculoviral IAP repeat-containing protein 2 isoform X1 [Aricia agestis]XP_041979978.1 baculoviral IAP repeat-containing protein 2 isoform X1 [Aricia agestis]XP_041979979.1 baculoviral IAP repeat-containing protein 2 isoform X1 [Aricia agestis]XP_041979980.1 baculoviral IAP repeat-containing protein 2 isoform X1 [Aricia agestis]
MEENPTPGEDENATSTSQGVSSNAAPPMNAEIISMAQLLKSSGSSIRNFWPSACEATVSSSSSAASSDKTDNRDTFGYLPESVDMRREEERLKTFDKWPVSFLSPEQLAKNGFYYLGRGDEVRCAFCKVEIMQWVEGDDPATDHERWAPQCPFLRRHDGARSIPADIPPTVDGRDECGAKVPPTATGTRLPGPVHAKYASMAARLQTFADWPRSMRQKPEDLAEAGFFYTGNGDKTKCFYCDGGLKDWENDDEPWEQHARWFNRCAYVQLVKGRDYVQQAVTKAVTITAPKEQKETPTESAPETEKAKASDEPSVEDSKLCKICFAEERNVCFVPCGHVVACAKCALATNKCPMCRRTFQNAVRLYFS